MLPAFLSRHLGGSTFPCLPPRVSLLSWGKGGERKIPGPSTQSPERPDLRPRAPPPRRGPSARAALPSALPGRSRGEATRSLLGPPGRARPPPGRCRGAGQKFTARPGQRASHGPGSRVPSSAARPSRSPRPRSHRRAERTPGRGAPQAAQSPSPHARPASGPRGAKFNFAGPRPLGGCGPGGGPPTGWRADPRALTCAVHSTGVAGGRATRCRPRRRRAGRVCGPAPAHVPTSRPPGRAHGPGRERASAHAPRCLPRREAAAQRAGAGRGREEVPAGGPAARPPPCPRPQLRPAPAAVGRCEGGNGGRNLGTPPGPAQGPSAGRCFAGTGASLPPRGPEGLSCPASARRVRRAQGGAPEAGPGGREAGSRRCRHELSSKFQGAPGLLGNVGREGTASSESGGH